MTYAQQTHTATANVLEGILADRLQIPAWEYEYLQPDYKDCQKLQRLLELGWAPANYQDLFLDECWMIEMAGFYSDRDEEVQNIPFEGERFYGLVSKTFEQF